MEIHAVYDRTVSVSVLLSMPYRNSKKRSCLEPPGSTLSGGREDVDLNPNILVKFSIFAVLQVLCLSSVHFKNNWIQIS
jgi:hypothetical protein